MFRATIADLFFVSRVRFHMTLVVSTKKRKENPAMVKTKASRNLLKSVAPLMIASPMEPAGLPRPAPHH